MTATRVMAAALLASLAAGCIEGELAPRSIVQQWRVLAVQADAPEIQPGGTVSFTPLVVTPDGEHAVHGEDGVTFEWVACVRAEESPGLSGAQYDPEERSEACGTAPVTFGPPQQGPTFSVFVPPFDPGAIEVPPEAEAVFGEVSPELLRTLFATVGIPATVQLTVRQGDDVHVIAFKRFLITSREELGENPPEPRFEIGDEAVSARDVDEPWICAPEDGTAPVLARDTEVILAPDPDDEHWREDYWVLDITGEVTRVRERPYYSWFSTDGDFDQQVTRAPIREEIWRTPEDPGTYPLWLVVRDGHGGMTACRAEVEVE